MLARIVHDDPLHVREHVAHSLRNGAWLLDADRVLLRTFALVARHAPHYRGRPDLEAWIIERIDEAVGAILREDADAERQPPAPGRESSREPGREHGAAFAALARPLGLEPEAMGRACLAFNRLPSAERQAFFALVIAGRTLDDMVRESGESATDLARRARRALEAVLGGVRPAAIRPASGDAPAARARKEDAREARAHEASARSEQEGEPGCEAEASKETS